MTSIPPNSNPLQPSTESLLSAALDYAALGFSVIPLRRDKYPLLESWKPYQTQRATPEDIGGWWERWPQANVGIITGQISAIVVLDMDSVEAQKLAHAEGLLVKSPYATTGRGFHVYYRHPGGKIPGFVGRLEGVDLRADGNYVMAPPSLHPNGRLYTWKIHPSEQPFAVIPDRLVELHQKPAKRATTIDSGGIGIHPPNGNGSAYGRKALQDELAAVSGASVGTRNATLNTAAYNLGQLVAGDELNESTTRADLHAVAVSTGLSEAEADRTIQSGIEAGKLNPRSNPNPLPAARPAEQVTAGDQLPTKETDTGNARRLVKLHGQNIRFVSESGTWFLWNGQIWKEDKTARIFHYAWETVAEIYHEGADMLKSEVKEVKERGSVLTSWGKQSENRTRLENMIALASKIRSVSREEFDQDHSLLNCQNGTIDLRTGQLRQHNRADLLTRVLPTNYDPDATCPTWLGFLGRVMNHNQQMIDFIQRAVGYTLTAETNEQCLFFLHGNGKNGKTTFIETLVNLLGDYALRIGVESIMSKALPGGIPNDIARLPGARLVISSETEANRRLNESLVKDLTGGDTMTARFLHREFFDFKPTHKLWMYGNHKPDIRNNDTGIWRRIKLIPFEIEIPTNERDPQLLKKLIAESSGLLTWAVQGCLEWAAQGLGVPEAVDSATNAYRAEMDTLSQFLDDCTLRIPGKSTAAKILYPAYKAWCTEAGFHEMNLTNFGLALVQRGVDKFRSGNGSYFYREIVMKTSQEEGK